MADETIEELQAKLEELKKENLKRQIALEEEKIKAENEKKAQEAEELKRKEIEDEVRERIKSEMAEKSGLPADAPVKLNKPNKWEGFADNYVKKHGLTGMTYEERIKSLVDEGNKHPIKVY